MNVMSRRRVLVAAGTVAAAAALGKPRAVRSEEFLPLSALKRTDPPVEAPDIVFQSQDGVEHHVSEFVGRGMVVNLWATWCAPCVAEMPALAKLALALAPADIAVLPLSSDRGGASVVRKFFDDHAITGLPVLLDPNGDAVRAVGARGLPTSLVIDTEGRERARLEGAIDWSSPEAESRVRELVSD